MIKLSLTKLFCPSLIGLVGAIALSNFSSIGLAQISPPISPIYDNSLAQTSSLTAQEIQNRLVGQWQMENIFFTPVTVVFTAQGKGFVLLPFFASVSQGRPFAYEFSYGINGLNQPLEIDITQPEGESIKTIFEFTNDGRIRVELVGINIGEPRPTEFTTGALFLDRVSNLTALPRNTEILNSLETTTRNKESVGRNIVGSLLRGQQAYFTEKDTFTTDIKELGFSFENNESDNYTYQIRGSLRQSVLVTATPKVSGLRSFAGVVFVVKQGDTNNFQAGICETIDPSTEPPFSPMLLNSKEIICAPGSRTPKESGGSLHPGF